MREFVRSHPDYKFDSVVSEQINYDLMRECERVTLGERVPEDLLPKHNTRSADDIPPAMQKAESYESSRKAAGIKGNGNGGNGNGQQQVNGQR